jgi:hypothetical protein
MAFGESKRFFHQVFVQAPDSVWEKREDGARKDGKRKKVEEKSLVF